MGILSRGDGPDVATLALVAAVAVLVGSLIPGPGGAEPPDPLTVTLGVDKLLHLGGYAVVGGLAASSRDWHRRASLALLVVGLALFGTGIEIAQAFVPGRTATLGDALANTVGATLGVGGGVVLRRWFTRSRRESASR